jgi:glycosyltransferase involved in cell wall biosynthesis
MSLYSVDPLHMGDPLSVTNLNTQPLRILFVGGALCGGGAERQLLQLSTELHELGHIVTVATIATGSAASEFRQVELWNGQRRTKVGTCVGLTRALFRLRRLCSTETPDIVIGWLSLSVILATVASKQRRIPVVAAIRNSRPEMQFGRHRGRILYAALRWCLTNTHLVIANSQAGVNGYTALGLIRRNQARVIRNGIDTREFQLNTEQSANVARAALSVAHDGPLALYVGRIAEEKDIPLLIRTVSSSLARRADLAWLVVGIAADRFLAIASSLSITIPADRVCFIARLEKMVLAYNASTILCLTSKREGSPNCVMEARACGLPVISTDCGDVRECARPIDRVVAADPDSFTDAIDDVLASASRRQHQGHQVLSANDCAQQWLSALQTVVHGEGKLPVAITHT